jgi:lipopolysaccharide transport system ATP-binding protein
MIDLEFNRVSKRYLVREEEEPTGETGPLTRKLRRLRTRRKEFWAVRDVSFHVARGEALGIIGHNGAGKSTILKLVSGITTPTNGEIKINGRLAALIEVGSGFHPELTGRENVFLSGSILGMRRREIAAKFDSIIDFAGVRQFIDVPVKRYSSGMYVRLGFAIAAHLDPDVLLLDEVLAVGDAAFQAKCFRRINELREAKKTIVFISHDLRAVEKLCGRVILMHHGQVAMEGKPAEVIERYAEITQQKDREAVAQPSDESDVVITGCEIYDGAGRARRNFEFGEQVRVRISVFARRRIEAPILNFGIKRTDGVIVCNFNNWYDNFNIEYLEGDCTLEGWLPPLRLIPASYEMHALLWQRKNVHDKADLTGLYPLASGMFGYFTVHGPALTEGDGVFQLPVEKWVWTMNGRQIDFKEMNNKSLLGTLEYESDAELVAGKF